MKQTFVSVKNLPESERPYEKCESKGAAALSDAELLAVIIRSGSRGERSVDVAARLLNEVQDCKGIAGLYHMSMNDMMKIAGIGRVKAIQLSCVRELAIRMSRATTIRSIVLNKASAVAEYFMESMRHLEREQLRLVLLDGRHRMLYEKVIFEGTVGMAFMEPREILIEALNRKAVFFIVLHNHPSGDPMPSSQDIASTKRLAEAGKLIGIHLSDHIVIGDNVYVSMSETGLI